MRTFAAWGQVEGAAGGVQRQARRERHKSVSKMTILSI